MSYECRKKFFMQYEYQNIIAKIKKDDWSSIIFSFIITDYECHAGKGRNTCHYKIANRIVFFVWTK